MIQKLHIEQIQENVVGFEKALGAVRVIKDQTQYRSQSLNAIKKGCSTQSIIGLASDLLEILCSHGEK